MLKLGLTVISSTLILMLKVHLLRLIIKRGVGVWYLLINSIFRDFKVLKLPLSHLCPFLLSYHRLLFAAAQSNTCLMASWRHLRCPHQSFAASAPIHELLYKLSSHDSSRFGFFFFFLLPEEKDLLQMKISSMEQNRKRKKHKLYFLDH